MPNTLVPDRRGDHRRIAIAVARFTEDISTRLLQAAVATLLEQGVADDDITVAWVPGSFELPLICDTFAQSGEFDAVIALGCVIRGETSHYDYVCDAAARGAFEAGLRHGLPVIFGVLTTENHEQALARSGGAKEDKGRDCALAALEMAGTMEAIENL